MLDSCIIQDSSQVILLLFTQLPQTIKIEKNMCPSNKRKLQKIDLKLIL